MKTKLLVLLFLAGSSMFAGPRVFVGFGFGAPYRYYAPPPVVTYAPAYPGYYSGYYYGPRYVRRPYYYAPPPVRVWVGPRWYGGRYYRGYWRR